MKIVLLMIMVQIVMLVVDLIIFIKGNYMTVVIICQVQLLVIRDVNNLNWTKANVQCPNLVKH